MTSDSRSRYAVWTDFGGVLTPPISQDVDDFCRREGIPGDAFRRAMATVAEPFGGDVMAPLDTPLIPEEEWASRVSEALHAEVGQRVDLSDFGERWFAGRRTNQRWLAHLRELRASGVFLGLISNMPPAWDRQWRRMVPPEGLFDAVVLSFQVGARKPDAAIFAAAVERSGLPPERCVLVDDLAANCAGAEAVGWRSVHFLDADDAAARLSRQLAGPATAGTPAAPTATATPAP
ncbi:HAD family hydrolase [Allostreptomyces psammosilenae]|uniref:Putative hydrolase of the HAD superfamily n=1 Tax=Allostreptomyces psammosilenae TaxID=1892865 RepID=A0A852ZNP2_9ACTN|nr:HAD family phosphatase [Allostreptomyces psammosilenae]NYI04066.1 putative hydrolase of the HAD superfamily [Allostreptomyces psammosilenae]